MSDVVNCVLVRESILIMSKVTPKVCNEQNIIQTYIH